MCKKIRIKQCLFGLSDKLHRRPTASQITSMQNLEVIAPKMAELLQFSSKVYYYLLTFTLVDLGYFINSSRVKNICICVSGNLMYLNFYVCNFE